MPKRRPHTVRYLETRRRANGVTAYYYCPPRKAVRAGIVTAAPLGTDLAAAQAKARRYNERLDAWQKGEDVEHGAPAHGSFDWVVQRFRQVRDRPTKTRKKKLSAKTKRDYDYYLNRTVEIRLTDGRRLGEVPVKDLKPRHAMRIYEIFGKADAAGDIQTHRAGLYAIQVCRRMWEAVVRIELEIELNPFKGLDIGGVGAREVEWLYGEVMDFVEAAREQDLLSVAAVALLCYDLVQRPVDMLRLTWGQLYDGTLVQSKGGQRAYFLISPELEAVLETLKRRNGVVLPRDRDRPIVLYEKTGQPFDPRNFRKKAADLRKAAGLRDELKIGDLRRSGATALTDAGATDSEARSLTGHATVDVFRKNYDVEKAAKAKKAHDKRMSARALQRAARAERKTATAPSVVELQAQAPAVPPDDAAPELELEEL